MKLDLRSAVRSLWRRASEPSSDATAGPAEVPIWGDVEAKAWIDKAQAAGRGAASVAGRVAIVNYSLGPGGAERQIVNTVRGLVLRGHRDIAVICRDLHSYPTAAFFVAELTRLGARIFDLAERLGSPEDAPPPFSGLPADLAAETAALAAIFREERPDAVYGWQDLLGLEAALAGIAIGARRIAVTLRTLSPPHYQGLDARYRHVGPGLKALLSRGVPVLANSEAVRESYARWLGVPAGALALHHNAFEEPAAAPSPAAAAAYRDRLGIAPGVPVVGSIMRFSAEKDPLLFVRTAAAIARRGSNARFVLAGDGPLAEEVRAEVAASGLEGRLVLPGTVPEPLLPLSAMDVFVLTSRIEGLPNVVLEAQWCGVPVVAPPVGGTPEIVASGDTGFIVESRDPERLAEAVMEVLGRPDWASAAAARARAGVQARFGMDAMIDRTVAALGL